MNRRTRWTALGIAAALAALAFYPILAFEPPAPPSESAVEGFFFEPAQTSAQLIYAMAAVLFFGRRRWIASALRAGDPSGALPGVLFLGSSAALFVWSVYTETMDLRIVSLVLAMLGAALLLGGWRMLRSILRPTLFLLFAVPIPAFIVNQVVVSMQFGTAHLASALLSLLDFDVTQRADLIYARDHVFQVIESCSGLRTRRSSTSTAGTPDS
jgi:exosortase